MSMDKSHDGTQPVEAPDATQQLPAAKPQDTPPGPATQPSLTAEPGVGERPAPAPEPAPAAPEESGYAAPVPAATPVTSVAPPVPERPRGPSAGTIVLAVIALAVAVLAILRETTDVSVNWSAIGPGVVIGAGVLLLLIGVVGLAQRERRTR